MAEGSSGFDTRVLVPLRTMLRGTVQAFNEYAEHHDWHPTDGSQALEELTSDRWAERPGLGSPLAWLHWAAWRRLTACTEHMRAMATLLEVEHLTASGHVPSARAAIETAARAQWLLEVDQPAEVRAARMMAERVHTLRVHERLPDEVQGRDPADRWQDIADTCETFGLDYRRRDGRVTKVGDVHRPPAGDLLRRVFDDDPAEGKLGPVLYAWLSGPTHGEPASLMRSVRGVPTNQGDVMETYVEKWLLDHATIAVVAVFAAAYDEWIAWFGWDWPHGWPSWTEHVTHKAREILTRAR